jgi:hypothetical protein
MCRVCGVTWQGAIVCLHEYNKRFASSSMGWFTDASVNMCMHERIAACLLPGWIDIRITRFDSVQHVTQLVIAFALFMKP